MKKSKKVIAIIAWIILRILTIPVFITSAISQIIEYYFVKVVHKIIEWSDDSKLMMTFNYGNTVNSEMYEIISEEYDELNFKWWRESE